MQTIGLIGGLSWESSAVYYEGLNKGVQAQLGGLHSAKVVLVSVDLAELTDLQQQGDWDTVAQILGDAAKGAEAAGADFLLLAATTFHRVYDQIAAAVSIPVVHLADLMAERIKAAGFSTVGFMGTAFTLTDHFFAERIGSHGINVNMPDELHTDTLDSIVYDELIFRTINPSSRKRVIGIVDELTDAGAEAIVFAASELSLLVRPQDVEIPVLDVITVHVEDAVSRALA
ncbi:aspartate/glutamate racemase family protein [Nocardioides sp. Kera G14]|uniref:aspartate/glutamate racemase family protein n=1 Tax=Nocardioides sp. Kera G14 TaxID=2884264 RepID=UPI001D1111D1|nr:amino acid racemase [Nocardioides sp. Kera G14]UDY24173.1 amino acid racemase [Nocardioides sp. Kera G14]